MTFSLLAAYFAILLRNVHSNFRRVNAKHYHCFYKWVDALPLIQPNAENELRETGWQASRRGRNVVASPKFYRLVERMRAGKTPGPKTIEELRADMEEVGRKFTPPAGARLRGAT